MNAVTVAEGQPMALALPENELIDTLRSSLYPGASDASIKMVIGWCRAAGKDPMKRPVHLVPMNCKKVGGGRDDYEWRDVVMPGIVDYRTDASRTGEHVGNEPPVFGEMVSMNLGGVEMRFPEWCEFTVLRMRAGEPRRFSSGRVYWLETYATASKSTLAPNSMWKKRPIGQLEKCAEAMALRRGFPEVGAQPTAEEMEGREFFAADSDDAPPAPSGPKVGRKAKTAPADVVDAVPAAPPAPAAEPAPEDQQGLDIPPPPPAATQAPPPAASASGEFVGLGEVAFLRNKAKQVGVDIGKVLTDCGGLVLERLTKTDFDSVKAALRKLEG